MFVRKWPKRLNVTLPKKTLRNSELRRRMLLVSSPNPRLLIKKIRKPKPLPRKRDAKPTKLSKS